jgi:phenylacetate-coenzyme A ligase PaaK-like adenylate-forming protein
MVMTEVEQGTTSSYEVARQRHLKTMLARVATESEKLTWPIERLHQLRDERLRDLIRHAQQNSPWHASRLQGIDADSLSGADLSAIPPMTKADAMAHWDEIVTDRRLTLRAAQQHLNRVSEAGPGYLLDDYHVVVTGGSSGFTGVFPWDWDGWLEAALASWRILAWSSRELGVPPGARTAFVAAGHASHISEAMRATFSPAGDSCEVPVTLPLAEITDRLNEFQPDMIVAYPTIMRRLAFEQRDGRLRISPRVILCGAEPLFPHMRETIEGAFGAAVINFYAVSETWLLACSCPGTSPGPGDLHLAEDTVVFEPVDADGSPVRPGEKAAKVLVTNVLNKVFPLIRYEVTDRVTILDTPGQGPWTGRRIAPIEGRNDDLFEYPGGVVIHPYVFWTPLWHSRIGHYQVRQTRRGADIQVELRGELPLEPVRQAIVSAYREAGHPDPVIGLRAVERIERVAATGKVRAFVPLPSSAWGPRS